MAKKKLTSEFFLFQLRRLETLVPKNHFVREVAPFPRSGHIYMYVCMYVYSVDIIFIVNDKAYVEVVYL